jgi:superfamily I DNA/RNA helicase
MVTWHPVDASSKNTGETLIINALRSDDKHPEIHVYHSVKISQSDDRIGGEADFIVLIPNKGIVVVEAKGATHSKIVGEKMLLSGVPDEEKDPFDQVQQIREELTDYLYAKGHSMPIARAVWLPIIRRDQISGFHSGIDVRDYELLTKDNLQNPTESLLNVINAYNAEQYGRKHFKRGDLFNSAKFDLARNAIRAEFEIKADKDYLREIRQNELQDLEEFEKKLLKGIERNSHLYFYGPAGCGKSMLLNELAFRAEESGLKVLVTCWNKMVIEELEDELGSVYSGITFKALGALMAEVAGVDEHLKKPLGDAWYFDELPKLAIEAAKNQRGDFEFEMIAVDEYQDVSSHPVILEFLRTVGKNQSWAETKVVLAGDKHQQIMRGKVFNDDPYALACEYIPDLFNYKLTDNFRNSPRIAKALEKLTGKRIKYDEIARNVIYGEIEIIETTTESLKHELVNQITSLRELFDDNEFRVLSAARTRDCMPLKLFTDVDDQSDDAAFLRETLKNNQAHTGAIPWRSIPQYKGLETEAVIIVDADEAQWNVWESQGKSLFEILYVGFSRARHHVVVICDSFVAEKLRALKL